MQGLNHPIDPLALSDRIGLDILISVMQTMHEECGDPKYRPEPLLNELVAAGYLGRKSGREKNFFIIWALRTAARATRGGGVVGSAVFGN